MIVEFPTRPMNKLARRPLYCPRDGGAMLRGIYNMAPLRADGPQVDMPAWVASPSPSDRCSIDSANSHSLGSVRALVPHPARSATLCPYPQVTTWPTPTHTRSDQL